MTYFIALMLIPFELKCKKQHTGDGNDRQQKRSIEMFLRYLGRNSKPSWS